MIFLHRAQQAWWPSSRLSWFVLSLSDLFSHMYSHFLYAFVKASNVWRTLRTTCLRCSRPFAIKRCSCLVISCHPCSALCSTSAQNTHTLTLTHANTNIHTNTHTLTHKHTQTHTHTLSHIHTNTHILSLSCVAVAAVLPVAVAQHPRGGRRVPEQVPAGSHGDGAQPDCH